MGPKIRGINGYITAYIGYAIDFQFSFVEMIVNNK
jgi:hypothetical protein